MAARLGILALITSLLVGCSAVQVTPSPTAELSASPSSSPSPSATPSASPSPTPSPTESPTAAPSLGSALSWQRIGTLKGSDQAFNQIAGFAAGYVVMSGLSIFFSADGKAWTAVDLPFHHSKDEHGIALEDHVRSIATDGSSVVIVGGYDHIPCKPANGSTGGGPECLTSPISWVSADGKTWRTSYPWRGPATPKPYKQGLEFSTVWAVPTGGWDAAVDYIAGESGGAGSILHSADGLTWTALPSAPPTALEGATANPPEFWGPAAAGPDGRRLVAGTWYVPAGQGADPVTHLFASADGASWKDVSSFPGAGGDIWKIVAPTPDAGDVWIVAGGDATGQPTIWTSSDPATWATETLPTGAPDGRGRIEDLDSTAHGLVALGSVSDTPDADGHHASWVQVDGVHWILLPRPDGADVGPDIVANGPAGVIGISSGFDSSVPADIWTLK